MKHRNRRIYDSTFLTDESGAKRVAERVIGRPIKEEEIIIHLNGDRTNFQRENLFVTNQAGLALFQNSIKNCLTEFIREGQIIFNPFNGVYEKIQRRRIVVQAPKDFNSRRVNEKKEDEELQSEQITIYVDIDLRN